MLTKVHGYNTITFFNYFLLNIYSIIHRVPLETFHSNASSKLSWPPLTTWARFSGPLWFHIGYSLHVFRLELIVYEERCKKIYCPLLLSEFSSNVYIGLWIFKCRHKLPFLVDTLVIVEEGNQSLLASDERQWRYYSQKHSTALYLHLKIQKAQCTNLSWN